MENVGEINFGKWEDRDKKKTKIPIFATTTVSLVTPRLELRTPVGTDERSNQQKCNTRRIHKVSFALLPQLENHLVYCVKRLRVRNRVMTLHDACTSGTYRVLTVASCNG